MKKKEKNNLKMYMHVTHLKYAKICIFGRNMQIMPNKIWVNLHQNFINRKDGLNMHYYDKYNKYAFNIFPGSSYHISSTKFLFFYASSLTES